MEQFVFEVVYRGTWSEVTVVSAETKEEAIQKIRNGEDVDDVIEDRDFEHEEIIDIY